MLYLFWNNWTLDTFLRKKLLQIAPYGLSDIKELENMGYTSVKQYLFRGKNMNHSESVQDKDIDIFDATNSQITFTISKLSV